MLSSKIMQGDCLDRLKELEDCSIDSIIADPPYGLKFMGKKWDYDIPSIDRWRECLRVLKPGSYLLSFAGTRTQHRMATNIEDAGFEIRDMIAWMYGSGFPKSLDISKAIDKAADVERKVIGERLTGRAGTRADKRNADKGFESGQMMVDITEPATPEARQWEGWGTALKPAFEPITVARKPLSEKTVAANVLKHGTGGINIDGCRIGTDDNLERPLVDTSSWHGNNWGAKKQKTKEGKPVVKDKGRFPANLIHDGSDEVMELFPQVKSGKGNFKKISGKDQKGNTSSAYGAESREAGAELVSYGDMGSAARFFYCAKASGSERHEGCSHLFWEIIDDGYTQITEQQFNALDEKKRASGNYHPTVKPVSLMSYLVKLVTPPGGICLDPFMGSGTTGIACKLEGFRFIGIDEDENHIVIAKARIKNSVSQIKMELQ